MTKRQEIKLAISCLEFAQLMNIYGSNFRTLFILYSRYSTCNFSVLIGQVVYLTLKVSSVGLT